MAPRSGIIAGKTIIVVQVQESIDKALNSISTRLNKFSANVGRLGLELFGGGLVGGILSKQITDTFKDFEDAILFLRTKLTASERDFQSLENTIRNLGRSTSFTAKEVAEAATVLAQGGLNARETSNSLQATLDLARGGQVTLSQAGEILINTMRSFSIETSKAEEVASQFIAASRLGTLDILNLKESIKEVLGTVRNLNIDLPTTLALLTQMAERSLKGTKAGTSLNTALLNLASKTEVLKKNLGITLPANINGDDFIKFLDQLYNRINQLGNLQRTAILQQLFNIRGGRAVTALDDLKKIIDLQKQIREAGNEARAAAVIMDSGFGGAIRRATSAVESLTITLGKLFSKALTPILYVVPAVSASLEKLALANESLLIPLVLVPPAMIGLGAGLLTLSFVGGKVAGVFGVLATSIHSLGSIAINGLNGQLVVLARTMGVLFNRVQRQGKGSSLSKKGGIFQSLDEGLSALLLTPQKVKKGASAGKVRPTSFFGRVGKADITTLGILKKSGAAAIAVLERAILKLSSVFGALETSIEFLDKSFASFVNRIKTTLAVSIKFNGMYKTISSNINTVTRNISNLKLAHVSVTKEINESINRLDEYTKKSEGYTKKALAAVAAQDRQTLLRNQLRQVDEEFNNLVASPVTGKRTKETKRQEAERRRQLALLGRRRKQIKGELSTDLVDPDDLAKQADYYAALAEQERASLENKRKQRAGLFVSLKQQKQELALGLKQRAILKEAGSRRNAIGVGNLLREGPKSLLGTLSSLFRKLGTGLRSVLGGALKLLITGLRNLPKLLDTSITGLFKFFKASGGFALGLLRIANGVRRFVFSVSGMLTIIELLIIFGPKIGFIRNAFVRLGEGFAKAFATIGNIFTKLTSVFSLFRKSFGNIFAGEGELGIQGLVSGFTELANIVKSNLKIAFLQVVEAIAPLYDFLRKIALSLLEIFSLVGSIFGATLGNLGGAIQGLTGGGAGNTLGAITESIKSIFSAENIKGAFSFVGTVLVEMARIVNQTIQNIFTVINNLATFIQSFLIKILEAISGGVQAFGSNLPISLEFLTKGLYQAASVIEKAVDSLIPEAGAHKTASDAIANSFKDTNKGLDNILTGFLNRLTQIFSLDTEANSVAEQIRTSGKRAGAVLRARQQAKIQDQANSPFGRIGGFLANLPGLLVQKAGQKIASLFAPKQPFDFKQLGLSLLDIGKDVIAKTILNANVRPGRQQLPQGSLRDIVSATVGTFRQTRGNLLKIAGGRSIDQQQLDTLRQVVTNTGGPNDNVFSNIKDLSKRAQPFVFQ